MRERLNPSTPLKKILYLSLVFSLIIGTFSINGTTAEAAVIKKPAKAVTTSVTSGNDGSVTIKEKKISGATGYQIVLAKDSSFKTGKVLINSKKTTVKTTKPATGNKYYVRARAYKKSGSKTVYGAWSAKKTVFVKPGRAAITGLNIKNECAVTVTYKKAAGSVSGYQIQYADNKSFNGKKTVNETKTSRAVKGLSGGKTYYFRVRQYKKHNGKTYYGAWSVVKTAKAKAHTHDFGEWETVDPATCEDPGFEERVCKKNPSHIESRDLKAAGHNYELTEETAPTCLTEGTRAYTCSVCGESYEETTGKLPHEYKLTDETAPTCLEEGTSVYSCINCQDSYAVPVPKTAHDYVLAEETDPTCTENGIKVYTCSMCNNSYSETIPASGHEFAQTDLIEPTEESEGVITYTCNRCQESYQTVLPRKEHEHVYIKTGTKDPVCTEDGYTVYECVCGASYTETAPALGHDYEETVTEATCTSSGTITHTCENCGDTFTEEIPGGHEYRAVSKTNATYTSDGLIEYTCSKCGDSYTETIPMLPHEHDMVNTATKKPTCTSDGYTTYTCSICGEKEKEVLPAVGHAYILKEETEGTCVEKASKTYICKSCGYLYKEEGSLNEEGHKFEWKETISATCEEAGSIRYECSLCGTEKITCPDSLKAKGHNFSKFVDLTPATCEKDGEYIFACSRCGKEQSEVDPAEGHNWEFIESSNGTCGMQGEGWEPWNIPEVPANIEKYELVITKEPYDLYKCSKCGEYEERPNGKKHVHHWTQIKHWDALCNADGYDIYACTGEENGISYGGYKVEYTPMLGHSPEGQLQSEDNDWETGGKCATCGSYDVFKGFGDDVCYMSLEKFNDLCTERPAKDLGSLYDKMKAYVKTKPGEDILNPDKDKYPQAAKLIEWLVYQDAYNAEHEKGSQLDTIFKLDREDPETGERYYTISYSANDEELGDILDYAKSQHLCTDDMTDYQKVKAISKWMDQTYSYDDTYKVNLYDGIFNTHTLVCSGYAILFQLMCEVNDLECMRVYSNTHAWNAVKVNGKYYYIDTTGGTSFFLRGRNNNEDNLFMKDHLTEDGLPAENTMTTKWFMRKSVTLDIEISPDRYMSTAEDLAGI